MIDADMFEPVPRQQDLPWRDREQFLPGAELFEAEDGFLLVLAPAAVSALRAGTARWAPKEAFGFLLGRTYQDGLGLFTVITDVCYADRAEAGPGHVRVDAEQALELSEKAEAQAPLADLKGWTHAHPVPSGYSAPDITEQAKWTDAHQVGVLTFMSGEPLARAYRGPRAERLRGPLCRGPSTVVPGIPDLDELVPAGPLPVPDGAPRSPARSPRRAERARAGRLARAVAIGVGLTLVALSTASLVRLDGVERRLGSLERDRASKAVADADWRCVWVTRDRESQAECVGPAGPGITGWLWDFEDGAVLTGRVVSRSYGRSGLYAVGLTLMTPDGTRDAGRHELVLLEPDGSMPLADFRRPRAGR